MPRRKAVTKREYDLLSLPEDQWARAFNEYAKGKAVFKDIREDAFDGLAAPAAISRVEFERRVRGVQCLSFMEDEKSILYVATHEEDIRSGRKKALRTSLEQMTGAEFRTVRRLLGSVKYRLAGAGASRDVLARFDELVALLERESGLALSPQETITTRVYDRPFSAGLGRAHVFQIIPKIHEDTGTVDHEVERLEKLREKAAAEVKRLERAERKELDGVRSPPERRGIADKYIRLSTAYMILADKTSESIITEAIAHCRKEHVNAEWALNEIVDRKATIFLGMKSEHMQKIALDTKEAGKKGILMLSGKTVRELAEETLGSLGGKTALFSRDLDPESVVILAGSDRVFAVIVDDMEKLGRHTRDLIRRSGTMLLQIPPEKFEEMETGDWVGVDAYSIRGSARVVANLTEEERDGFAQLAARVDAEHAKRRSEAQDRTVTRDGVYIVLSQNADTPLEVEHGLGYGMGGIGLYRSESPWVPRVRIPTEDEQTQYCRAMLLPVSRGAQTHLPALVNVARYLDAAGDKNLTCLGHRIEGRDLWTRGSAHFLLDNLDIVELQTAAFLKSGFRHFLIPCVETPEQVQTIKEIARKAAEQRGLTREYGQLKWGAMFESPIGIGRARAILKEVDFAALGSNDTTLTTLGLNTQEGSKRFDPTIQSYEPAVLRHVWELGEAVKSVWGQDDVEKNRLARLSCCGEAAGEIEFQIFLIGAGYRKFSVNLDILPTGRRLIQDVRASAAENAARRALETQSPQEAKIMIADVAGIDPEDPRYRVI